LARARAARLHAVEPGTIPTIRHILCPIDFSEPSRKAFQYAVGAARRFESRLTALHVVPEHLPPLSGLAMSTATAFDPDARERLRGDLGARLRAFLEPLAEPRSFDSLVEEGSAAGQIATLAHALRVDLVVMGTHGYGGLEKLILGSTTEKTLHKVECAVLTIPPDTETEPAGLFRRVLSATDFSEPAERAFGYAVALAKPVDGRVELVHVLEAVPAPAGVAGGAVFDSENYRSALEQDARQRLGRLVTAETAPWCGEPVVRAGKAYVEILAAADELRADLIALGARGQGTLDAIFGSTSYQIARRARCPVLTARAPVAG
jgi:nucleotide-binding universal stress UspA family protein